MNTITASRYAAEYQSIAPCCLDKPCRGYSELRTEALEKFSAQGFPSLREEEWRYTNVSAIEKKLFSPSISSASGHIDTDWLKINQLEDVWSVVFGRWPIFRGAFGFGWSP